MAAIEGYHISVLSTGQYQSGAWSLVKEMFQVRTWALTPPHWNHHIAASVYVQLAQEHFPWHKNKQSDGLTPSEKVPRKFLLKTNRKMFKNYAGNSPKNSM
jgi:hypothetical protein